MNKTTILLAFYTAFAFLTASTLCFAENKVAQHLQDVSATVLSDGGSGSGVFITREMKESNEDDAVNVKVNFIWTAAHVVADLRSEREIIDSKTGTKKTVVEFKPVNIAKDLVEDGRKVGETRMQGKVIKFSDSENGEDLAFIMLYKKNFVDANTEFYLEGNKIIDIGTPLFHVGSLLGQGGSNSMTTGIVSQVGRVVVLNNKPVIFDQTTVTAFPGSSGGGVFDAEKGKEGLYMGMLVRGAGETFNLVVPIRRMYSWAKNNKLEWALDESVPTPSLEDVKNMSVEDTFEGVQKSAAKSSMAN